MATRFDGSDIASVSVEPVRLIGTRWCRRDEGRRDQPHDLGRDVHRRRVDQRQAILLLQEGGELGLAEEAAA